jgi:predicted transposase YbfD/YdcC
MVRDHWAIENSVHWVLDMVLRDGECRVRTDHAPTNFTTIKHIALNLIRRASRKAAAWNDDYLKSLIVA